MLIHHESPTCNSDEGQTAAEAARRDSNLAKAAPDGGVHSQGLRSQGTHSQGVHSQGVHTQGAHSQGVSLHALPAAAAQQAKPKLTIPVFKRRIKALVPSTCVPDDMIEEDAELQTSLHTSGSAEERRQDACYGAEDMVEEEELQTGSCAVLRCAVLCCAGAVLCCAVLCRRLTSTSMDVLQSSIWLSEWYGTLRRFCSHEWF